MGTELKRTHYLAVVPLWLAQTLHEQDVPLDHVVSFPKLASILSVEDVCFYYEYLLRQNFYTEEAFSDFENIAYTDENFAWLSEHANVMKKTSQAFSLSFDKAQKDITTNLAPITVRKVPFRPAGVFTNILVLVGTAQTPDYDRNIFYSDCMGVLSSQIGATGAEKFKVFERYTQS